MPEEVQEESDDKQIEEDQADDVEMQLEQHGHQKDQNDLENVHLPIRPAICFFVNEIDPSQGDGVK